MATHRDGSHSGLHRTGWCGHIIEGTSQEQHGFHDWCCVRHSTVRHHAGYFRPCDAISYLAMDLGITVICKLSRRQTPIPATIVVRSFNSSRRVGRHLYRTNLAWWSDLAEQCFMDEVYQRRGDGCLAADVLGRRQFMVGFIGSKPCKEMAAIFEHGLVQCNPAHRCCSVTCT